MIPESNKDTIIATLSSRVERLEALLPERERSAYERGFNEGMRIDLHFMVSMDEEIRREPLSKEILVQIKDGIRKQIVDNFTPVLPVDIQKWLRDCVYDDNLMYHNFKKSKQW